MSEWKECILDDIAYIIPGYAFKSKHFGKLGTLVIKIADINPPYINVKNAMRVDLSHYDVDKLSKYNLEKNDFVIAMTGATIGKIGRLKDDTNAIVNQRVAKILPKEDIVRDFVYYCIQGDDFQGFIQNNIDSHSAQENISGISISRYPVLLPSQSEQKAIASVLSSLDNKIDLLHRQNKTLEAMAETLFRQWFVEEAKDDWEEGCLGDVIELAYGKGLKNEIRTGIGYPVIGSSGVVGYHSEFLVEGPGIVIGRKGTLGKTIYINENFYPIDTTYYVKSKNNSEGMFYEYLLLKTIDFHEMDTDSAVPGLNREIAISTEMIVPSLSKILGFNDLVRPIFGKISKNQTQIRILKKLRDMLLPKLMSGEIRVSCEENQR